MSIKFLTAPSKTLRNSITAAATSFQLNDILGWDGETNLAAGDFGTTHYAIFRNATKTQIELMEIDPATIASTSITITRRGLQFDGNLTTEVTANKLSWVKGDTFVDLGTVTSQTLQWLKEYIDGVAIAGAPTATTAILGLTTMSTAPADPATPIAVGTNDTRLPTQDENNAIAGGGNFGTPSSSNKFITEAYNASASGIPVVRTYLNAASPATWTKPTGLKYIIVEVQAAGGAGATITSTGGGGGGGGGGYGRKMIPVASLGTTETITIGLAGANSSFGSHVTAVYGTAVATNQPDGGAGGSCSGGDINITGGTGGQGVSDISGGYGGQSQFGSGGKNGTSSSVDGAAGVGYGSGGGGGATSTTSDSSGGAGAPAIVIVTEYYS